MHPRKICHFAVGVLFSAWTLSWFPFLIITSLNTSMIISLNIDEVIVPDTPENLLTPPTSNERKSCYPYDSCQDRRDNQIPVPLAKRSCFCDFACAEYGDCCKDSPFYDSDSSINAMKIWRCTKLRNYHGIFLKVACPSWWTDDEIRRLCETDILDEHNPFLILPVTSRITQFTYKNYYCAVCNKDSDSSIFWKPNFACDGRLGMFNFTDENLRDRIQYKKSVKSWGITTENNTFIPCSVASQIPLIVKEMVRCCDPFVFNCSANWTDFEMLEQCLSYTTYVYSGQRVYRNWECARCNYVPSTDIICTKLTARFQMASYSALLNWHILERGAVGHKPRCPYGTMLDPYTRICRVVRHGSSLDPSNNWRKRKKHCIRRSRHEGKQ